jgi:hypothetical protein
MEVRQRRTTDPSLLIRGLESMLENEREPAAGEDETSGLKRLTEINVKQ